MAKLLEERWLRVFRTCLREIEDGDSGEGHGYQLAIQHTCDIAPAHQLAVRRPFPRIHYASAPSWEMRITDNNAATKIGPIVGKTQ